MPLKDREACREFRAEAIRDLARTCPRHELLRCVARFKFGRSTDLRYAPDNYLDPPDPPFLLCQDFSSAEQWGPLALKDKMIADAKSLASIGIRW